MFVKTSLGGRLDCFANFVGKILFCSPLSASTTQLSDRNLSSHYLCCSLDSPSTTYICKIWHNKFHELSNHAFCSWDDIFKHRWNSTSANNMCKCTSSRPRCRPILLQNGITTCLKTIIL